MSTALAVIQAEELDTMQRTAALLVASGYFTGRQEDRNTAIAQLATKIMAGKELGYGPYAAVNGIHIIQGKPQISANLMAAAVKAHPRYDYRVLKMDDEEVVIRFLEDGKAIGDSSFTAADAKRAGTQNTQKYPRNMLFARAISNGVRWYAPDVFYGNSVYVEGEIGGEEMDTPAYIVVDKATGEVIEPAPSINSLDDVDALPFDEPKQPAPKLPDNLRKRLHAVGTQAYGKEWDAKRPELVRAVTKGRATSSNDLTEDEGKRIEDIAELVTLAKRVYGMDEYESNLQRIVDAVTKGRTESYEDGELTGREISTLISGLTKKVAEMDKQEQREDAVPRETPEEPPF